MKIKLKKKKIYNKKYIFVALTILILFCHVDFFVVHVLVFYGSGRKMS